MVYSACDTYLVFHFQRIAEGSFSFSSFLYYIFRNQSLVYVVLTLVVVSDCTLEVVIVYHILIIHLICFGKGLTLTY
jgi:hypothetical protein